MTISWHEVPIAKKHNRDAFDCGDAALNEFLRKHARQSHDLGGAKTFLAMDDAESNRILGFYSLSVGSIKFADLPKNLARGLARHDAPVFRLVRLAVDVSMQGKGIGGQLLMAAGRRCLQVAPHVGGVALLIDAKNDAVAQWYASYGAVPLVDLPLSLLLPMATIEMALRKSGHVF